MKIRRVIAGIGVMALATGITACSSGGDSGGGSGGGTDGTPSGEITVLTQRTDLVQDGTLDEYAQQFEDAYPGTTVKFESLVVTSCS